MKQCPECGEVYVRDNEKETPREEIIKGDEPCGKCEEGVENREARL